MRIAIASGKGGTGKTTIATNLAVILADCGQNVTYADCDVEAPNGHLFLHPEISRETSVKRLIPTIDDNRCIHCGECGRFCHFGAITCLPNTTLVHPELCHNCGGCSLICPQKAIQEKGTSGGVVQQGIADGIIFVSGVFKVGLANSTPVIRATKNAAGNKGWVLLDAPPGTSCAMIETLKSCDFVILVTEPTPFGLHDLRLAMEVTGKMNLPFGVVINRNGEGAEIIRKTCVERNIPILAEIPENDAVERAYSEGKIAVRAIPELRQTFSQIPVQIAEKLADTNSSYKETRDELFRAMELNGQRKKKAEKKSR